MRIEGFGYMPQEEVIANAIVVEAPRNENQFFDFEKQKVQPLTLEQLMRTNKENRGDDRSCPHGIYHFALINKVLEMCAEHGYDAEIYDLFATNNRDKQTPGVSLYPELETRFGERAVEAHTLRRVYANIRIKDFDDEELTTNMAISYTQKGIQVGFGTNVKVCHNQCMLGSGQFVADYSVNGHYTSGEQYKTNLAGIFSQIGTWLTDAEHINIRDRETIERMKKSIMTPEQLYTILGALLTIRVASDTQVKEIKYKGGVYPLNQAQMTKFTESLLVKQQQQGRISAWDFYNCATELYKPMTAETNLILPQNMSMMNFMRQYELF